MLSDTQLLLLMTGVSLTLFWALPAARYVLRAYVLLATSFLLLSIFSLEATAIAILATGLALIMSAAQKKFAILSSIIFSLLIFLPLIVFNFYNLEQNIFVTLGLSYYTLKLYSFLRDSLQQRNRYRVDDVLLYVFFFPVFSSGPIENIESINTRQLEIDFNLDEFLYGVYRSLLGIFKVTFVCTILIKPFIVFPDLNVATSLDLWLWTMISFFYLYVNFSGYSDLAIGLARLYGVDVRENFNKPYLATNVKEFWQRWHMSLGNWVMKYAYWPIVRASGKPMLGLVIVFILIGIWHKFSLNYLLWGFGHGIGMVLATYFGRELMSSNRFYEKLRHVSLYRLICAIVTMSYVAILSRIANFDSISQASLYLQALLWL